MISPSILSCNKIGYAFDCIPQSVINDNMNIIIS